jgi:DNA-binding beta-propeller fold protein YncE
MREPVDFALGPGDRVHVLARGLEAIPDVPWNRVGYDSHVRTFTIGTTPGDEEFINEFGKYGDEEGRFIWPTGLAVDSQENVYVTDEWLNLISIYDKDGNFVTRWGVPGRGDGELNRPAGIEIDREDHLHIVDSLNHRVQKFTKDGRFLGKWGSHGSGDGELDSPWGIVMDREGYIYLADHKNNRAQKFTPEGEFVAKFGSYGAGTGQLTRPTDVAVDPDGDVYVCDWINNRVQAYEPDGRFFMTFVGDAVVPSKWHQMGIDANADVGKARRRLPTLEPTWRLVAPRAVVFDADKRRLMISDTVRGRIQIYNKLGEYQDPQRNL